MIRYCSPLPLFLHFQYQSLCVRMSEGERRSEEEKKVKLRKLDKKIRILNLANFDAMNSPFQFLLFLSLFFILCSTIE